MNINLVAGTKKRVIVQLDEQTAEIDKIYRTPKRSITEAQALKEDYMFECGMTEAEADVAVQNCFAYEDNFLN